MKKAAAAKAKPKKRKAPPPKAAAKAKATPAKAAPAEKVRATEPEEFVVREEIIEVEEVIEPEGRPGTGEAGGRKDGEFGDFEDDLDEDTEDFSPKASDPDVTMDDHDWGDEEGPGDDESDGEE